MDHRGGLAQKMQRWRGLWGQGSSKELVAPYLCLPLEGSAEVRKQGTGAPSCSRGAWKKEPKDAATKAKDSLSRMKRERQRGKEEGSSKDRLHNIHSLSWGRKMTSLRGGD